MHHKLNQYYNQKQNYGINQLRRRNINSLVDRDVQAANKKILDLGCAAGYISSAWKENNYIVGLDISARSVDQASQVLDAAYLVDLEADNWPSEITSQRFDIILCAELLEHLFAPEDFLLKLKRFLTPTGYIIITTPNFLVWNNRLRIFLGHYGLKEIFNDSGHIRLFSHNSLHHLLRQTGLKVIHSANVYYPNFLEKFSSLIPANLFVYQTIIKVNFKS